MQTFGIIWAEGRSGCYNQVCCLTFVDLPSVILTIRVWALWGRGRNIGIFLGIVSIINGTVGILGFIFFWPTHHCVSEILFQALLTTNIRLRCPSRHTNGSSFTNYSRMLFQSRTLFFLLGRFCRIDSASDV